MLSSQQTGDRRLRLFSICVHGLRSPKPPHHTHTLSPLQPTAHLASMEYPLNISLYSPFLTPQLEIFFSARASTHTSANSQPTAAAVTCVCWDVIQLLSFSKSSPKHFCSDTHTSSQIYVTQIALFFCPASYFSKSNFVCLQLSVTRVGKERLNQGGDQSRGS